MQTECRWPSPTYVAYVAQTPTGNSDKFQWPSNTEIRNPSCDIESNPHKSHDKRHLNNVREYCMCQKRQESSSPREERHFWRCDRKWEYIAATYLVKVSEFWNNGEAHLVHAPQGEW